MDEESALEQAKSKPLLTRSQFRTSRPVQWIIRRLGQAATRPAAGVRSLVRREFSLPTPEQLLGTSDPFGIRERRAANSGDPKDRESLRNLAARSHEVIAQATTLFPFTPFPDTVTLDRTKVTIRKRNFFWSEDVVSIRIEDVLNATVSTDLIFGSLNIASRVMNSTDHYQIKFFRKREAMFLKHLIQGYVIAQHNNIRVSHLSRGELIETLLELGHDGRQ